MFKTTSTFTQARNIAMALTMTFAATTLTACGGDDGSDATQSPEAEVSTDNQNSTAENTSEMENNTTESDSEAVAESDETATAEPEQTDSAAETENGTAEAAADESAAEEPANTEPESHAVTAQGLKYSPLVVKINPGDTVVWRNMSTHNTESLEGLIPEGAEMWNSPMSENYRRTFTVEGIYIYKCTPHFGAGMGGAIIVGDPVNLEQIKAADAPGAAGRLVRKAISEAESM